MDIGKKFQLFLQIRIAKGLTSYIISFAMFWIYLYVTHQLVKTAWPLLLQAGENGRWPYVYILKAGIESQIINFIGCIPWYFVYTSKKFEKYRVQKGVPFPWEKDIKKWYQEILPGIIKVILTNAIISLTLAIPDSYLMANIYRKDLESFPQLSEVIPQIIFCMIMEDLFFYLIHRAFHHKSLMKYHMLHHEHHVTHCLSPFYQGKLDYIFAVIIPNIVGWKILQNRMHYATYSIWLTWRTFETQDGHSGYELPWSPSRIFPFAGSSDYHNFHHSNHQEGNYGSFFTIWDTVFGTNSSYLKHNEKLIKTKYQ